MNVSFEKYLESGKHRKFPFFLRGQCHDLALTEWKPKKIKGIVIYQHGLQSHKQWFYPNAEKLVKEGYLVCACDRLGSGESAGLRGHVDSYRDMLRPLEDLIEKYHNAYPHIPIILWGNSFGAKIVTQQLVHTNKVRAAIFTVAGNFKRDDWKLPFSKWQLLFSKNKKYFPSPIAESDADNGAKSFVTDGEFHQMIKQDNLSNRKFTRRFYIETAKLDRLNLQQASQLKHYQDRLGYFVVEGDRMMDNQRLKNFVDRHCPRATFKTYSGGEHHDHFLSFTSDGEQAFKDIVRFLEGVL